MGARIARLAGPHDVAHALDGRVLRMHRMDLVVEQPAHDRRQPQHVARRHRFEAGKILLRLEDGVEVAAVGDVEHQLAHARHVDGDLAGRKIRGDVGDAHAFDEAALLLVARHHAAGRRIDVERARRRRRHQPVLDRHGDGADRAVAAHRQAAAHLDEQDADVAVGAGRRIEHRARHHVVAARLEHQRLADPVVVGEEIEPPLAHGGALEQGRAARHQPHRIAAGVAVEAGEGMDRHGDLRRRRDEALDLALVLQAYHTLLPGETLALDRVLLPIAAMGLQRPQQDRLAAEEGIAEGLAIAGAPKLALWWPPAGPCGAPGATSPATTAGRARSACRHWARRCRAPGRSCRPRSSRRPASRAPPDGGTARAARVASRGPRTARRARSRAAPFEPPAVRPACSCPTRWCR